MILPLVRKLLRDVGVPLLLIAGLLCLFQMLWASVTARIVGQLSPFFNLLGRAQGYAPKDLEQVIFDGPGKIIRTLMGGESVNLERAMDLLTIGWVHPLMVTVFCIWAVGRAASAIAGELDRGTLELLLSQPLGRARLVLAHLIVDAVTIPLLCLSLWAGSALGVAIVTPIQVRDYPQLKRFEQDPERLAANLHVDAAAFGRATWAVGGLIFAVSGYTMWLSARGRFRWQVLGLAVLITLVMFLVNLIGQMWDLFAPLRPLTIFYYYQPQQLILGQGWTVDLAVWNNGQPLLQVPILVVLYGVGAIGYLMALRTFCRRDLPAPL